jgi:hypothetical protein
VIDDVAANRPRRVVVATSAVPTDPSWLALVRELSAGFGDELLGLFVEDVNAFYCAALPFTQAVGATSGTVRAFEPEDFARLMERQAQQTQQALRSIATEAGCNLSFSVVRGSVDAVVLKSIRESDLLILPRWSHSACAAHGRVLALDRPSKIGERAQEIVRQLASDWNTSYVIYPWHAVTMTSTVAGDGSTDDPISAICRQSESGTARVIVIAADIYADIPLRARARLRWAHCPVIVIG